MRWWSRTEQRRSTQAATGMARQRRQRRLLAGSALWGSHPCLQGPSQQLPGVSSTLDGCCNPLCGATKLKQSGLLSEWLAGL